MFAQDLTVNNIVNNPFETLTSKLGARLVPGTEGVLLAAIKEAKGESEFSKAFSKACIIQAQFWMKVGVPDPKLHLVAEMRERGVERPFSEIHKDTRDGEPLSLDHARQAHKWLKYATIKYPTENYTAIATIAAAAHAHGHPEEALKILELTKINEHLLFPVPAENSLTGVTAPQVE